MNIAWKKFWRHIRKSAACYGKSTVIFGRNNETARKKIRQTVADVGKELEQDDLRFVLLLELPTHRWSHQDICLEQHTSLWHQSSPFCFGGETGPHLRQDPPLEAILVIFGRKALIFICLKALGKKLKNDATFVRMRSGDHLGDAKMSK